jgi:translation elongation factor EF-4
LIENKIDLVSEDEVKNVIYIREFSEHNKFINFFRCSAKLGLNVNEAMEFLIKIIVERMDATSKDNQTLIENDRKSIILGDDKYSNNKDQSKGGCC